MKKIFALLLSAAMLATMSITAFAAETDGSAGSVNRKYWLMYTVHTI